MSKRSTSASTARSSANVMPSVSARMTSETAHAAASLGGDAKSASKATKKSSILLAWARKTRQPAKVRRCVTRTATPATSTARTPARAALHSQSDSTAAPTAAMASSHAMSTAFSASTLPVPAASGTVLRTTKARSRSLARDGVTTASGQVASTATSDRFSRAGSPSPRGRSATAARRAERRPWP